MASKRKSSVPCMVPLRSKHMREDVILGSLPELLPTIPEDSILSISKDEDTQRFHNISKPEVKTSCWRKGTYTCLLCCFDSSDLNLLLHHLDDCHMDFHAQPNFYCLSCKVTAVTFEGLTLHNAKSHPGLHKDHKKVSLQVTKRDGAITVEQTLFTGEDWSESGISTTKTPIMKMTKGGHKKIVVSHTVEVQRAEPRNKPATITNGTQMKTLPLMTSLQIVGGAGAATIHKIMPNMLGTSGVHNRGPLWSSNPSSPDLPKVMIPLSSIPTYDPAMDLSSFLKTSFGKFPYPTKAELCYLTVVSGFPEEQIKLWFTAQRLKQGISWSPEEIEDTRRKMFNTVFQAPAKISQNQSLNHISQPCVAVQSAFLSSNSKPQIPKGGTMGWKGGVVVSQPSVTQATSLKQQPMIQTPHVNIHHTAVPKETGTENFNITHSGGSVSNHGHTGKSETGSSKTNVSCLPAITNSQTNEGSIMNLTNIVRKINNHIKDRKANCTSKTNSSASIYEQPNTSSNTNEGINISSATTSKNTNGSTYEDTSHRTICTKREGNISDTSKKSNTDTSVICSSNRQDEEFMTSLTHNIVPKPGGVIDSSLTRGKLLPETLKQSLIDDIVPEQKQVPAPQDLPVGGVCNQPYHVRSSDTPSVLGSSFSYVSGSSLHYNPTTSLFFQEEPNENSSPSPSAPQERSSPKNILGAPQVQSPDCSGTPRYEELEPKSLPALDKNSKLSNFDINITQKESKERMFEAQSRLTNTFHKAEEIELSNQLNTLHTFINNNKTTKQGMPHLRQYEQEVDQCNSSYPVELNKSPIKINVIALNKDDRLYEANNKQLKMKPSQSWVSDGCSSHKNQSSEWQESYEHVPIVAKEQDAVDNMSGTGNIQPRQLDNKVNSLGLETKQVKHDLCSEQKSIFQNLDSEAPVLPINKTSKETMEALDKPTAGEQDYWEIKHEEHQQPMVNQNLRGHQAKDSQSRDCLRGELLKV